MKIICDTSVWCRLALDRELHTKVQNSNLALCPSMINIVEFVSNKKFFDNNRNWMNAIKIAHQYKENSIKLNVMGYIARTLNFKPKKNNEYPYTSYWLEQMVDYTINDNIALNDERIQTIRKGMRHDDNTVSSFSKELKLNAENPREFNLREMRKSIIEDFQDIISENYMVADNFSDLFQDTFHVGIDTLAQFEVSKIAPNIKTQKKDFETNDINDVMQFFFLNDQKKIWTFERLNGDNAFKILAELYPEKIFHFDHL